jgi:hypothetical protein
MHKALRLGVVAFAILAVLSVAVPATAAQDISKSPQVAAYQALLKAVKAGDFEGYKKSMTKAAGAEIDKQIKEMGMDPKKGMEMLKSMMAENIKYTALKVDGKKAVLSATGRAMDSDQYGTIDLEEEAGGWKVAQQSWTNEKK